MIKIHLTKASNGKNACGRNLIHTHMAAPWDIFSKLSQERQCEICAKSKVAEFNKKNDAKKVEVEDWEPEDKDAWMKADDALVAAKKNK